MRETLPYAVTGKIGRATCRSSAKYPFLVQRLNTENWNTSDCSATLAGALAIAERLALQYPALAWRVLECTGGAEHEVIK